jgi:hypothetical protein
VACLAAVIHFSPGKHPAATGPTGTPTASRHIVAATRATGRPTATPKPKPLLLPAVLRLPDGKDTTSVAFGPAGKTLAVGTGSSSLISSPGHTYLWDTSARKLIATFTDPGGLGVW